MSNNLRDQLLGLGFKPSPTPERPAREKPRGGGKPQQRQGSHPSAEGKPARAGHSERARPPHRPAGKSGAKPHGSRSREDIELGKAYALRAQREKEERIAAEAAKQEEARKRREARTRLSELVKGKALNAADAEIARHFPYGGKIKRIYVTAEQLKSLNAGGLGVLQLDGRYLLVTADVLAQAEDIFPPAVALKVDPTAPAEEDPYSDPKYQVPDDLVW